MTRIESVLAEFAHETATARRHLERLPAEQFTWRPHPKSFTVGQLGSHMVDCIRWVESIFGADELDMDPGDYHPFVAESVAVLLETFDADVVKAQRLMASSADTSVTQPWRLTVQGTEWFVKPREAVYRDMVLNHLIHHRGQCSVYLRLLEVPVPDSYGPTADE